MGHRAENRAWEKFDSLLCAISRYDKVAVAYSGGVDSSLLLYAAKTALTGPGKVIALTAISPLCSSYSITGWRTVFNDHFAGEVEHREINMNILENRGFVSNNSGRCYICKKIMYSLLTSSTINEGFRTLLDGTNSDDLEEQRPGLQAIRELGVKTPLSDAGLNKDEIRQLAKDAGLSNHALPSNSCLATRVVPATKITLEMLQCINHAELFMLKLGFSGCRVKPQSKYTRIELEAGNIENIADPTIKSRITSYFIRNKFLSKGLVIYKKGFEPVLETIEFKEEQFIT